MDKINTEHLERCIETLEISYNLLQGEEEGSVLYEVYRNSLVKGFEMSLEQSGKLLKKRITPYFASKKEVDKLTYKDIFRFAHKHSIIDENMVERWFKYRDNRNNTAHDYGIMFAEETLELIGNFIDDAKSLQRIIENA